MKGSKPDFSESDALQHVSFKRIGPSEFADILKRTKILDAKGLVTAADKAYWSQNLDVSLWLNTVISSTGNVYLTNLLYYSKCVTLSPPALLDLKMSKDPETRYFPAEQLMENWIRLAKQKKLLPSKIFGIVNATNSFYSHSRVPLIEISYVYKPKPKPPLDKNFLRTFREGFNFYSKVLFDFIVSVPVRDGQFLRCKYCGEEFFPRWRHIETFPKIEPFSAFVIKPEKGHESEKYREDIRQICFLTKTAAAELNALRDLKEAMLQRTLGPDEYIFTHQMDQAGITHVTPIARDDIGTIFRTNVRKTGVHIWPHLIRTWTNTTLASKGIDQQIRWIYLGHQRNYELSYMTQMIPQWRQTFQEKKALEALEEVSTPVQSTPETPRPELPPLSNEEHELLRGLLRRFKAAGTQF
jgi:hypothetical protein